MKQQSEEILFKHSMVMFSLCVVFLRLLVIGNGEKSLGHKERYGKGELIEGM